MGATVVDRFSGDEVRESFEFGRSLFAMKEEEDLEIEFCSFSP